MRHRALAFILVVGTVFVPLTVSAGEEAAGDTGAVYGTVTDSVTGAPIDDVCVSVRKDGAETEYHASTNNNGVYEIGGMAPGSYDLRFDDCERPGHDPVETGVTVTAGAATKVDVVLSLSAGYGAVTGVVTDADSGEPIAYACVKLYHSHDDILVATAWTNGDGGYVLPAEAGDYRVRFKPCEAGYYFEQWYDGAEGWDGSTVVTVTAGAYHDGVDAALVPDPNVDAVVWGYVVEGDTGHGVHGYCVSLYRGEEKVKTVLTGEAGGWEVAVDPGEYRIKAWPCEGHADLGTVWYLAAEEFAGARVVGLEPGAVVQLDTIVVGDVRFRDAIDNYFLEDIVWLAEHGITLGCNEDGTEFCPNETVTRAQMAAFLHRALKDILEGIGEHEFADDDGSIFEDDIEWLASVGVTTGCDAEGEQFCPHDSVIRSHMAAFLHRALGES